MWKKFGPPLSAKSGRPAAFGLTSETRNNTPPRYTPQLPPPFLPHSALEQFLAKRPAPAAALRLAMIKGGRS
jgi:hypothetical protein